MQSSVLISMIGCGRALGTSLCLERTLLTTAPDVQFVLTDNASRDATWDLFEKARARHPHRITTFREPENTGFIPPGNRAFHLSVTRGCEFTVLLNDDTDPPDGWLEKLLEPFSDPSVALVCPQGTCCTLDDQFNGSGGKNFEYCEGSCLAIRNSAIRSFSATLFDENLTGIYGDDSNLSLRAREKGWKIAQAAFPMPHIRSATTRSPEVKAFCDHHRQKNHEYNVKRWGHYLKCRRMDFPIVLHRSYAIGDVLLTTPLVRAIAKSNPLSPIFVVTDYPVLFDRSPYATGIHAKDPRGREAIPADALCIELDGAYENRTMVHIVHAYEDAVRQHLPGLGKVELKTDLFPSKDDMAWAAATKKRLLAKNPEGKLAYIGSDKTTWAGKNWEPEKFHEVRERLHAQGWTTTAVGSKKTDVVTTIHQLAALLSMADLFVGHDSFPLHAAQAMGCPTVGLFGATLSRMILTQGSKAAAAEADRSIPCAGERHRLTGKTHTPCDGACMRSIQVDDVMAAINKLEVL